MNLCVPIERDEGLSSPLSDHFGSAPAFLVVDTGSGACRAVPNAGHGPGHGGGHGVCGSVGLLAAEQVGGVAVRGIGQNAAARLAAAGLTVFMAPAGTAGDVLSAFRAGTLRPFTAGDGCGHHGQGQGRGCRHGPGQG